MGFQREKLRREPEPNLDQLSATVAKGIADARISVKRQSFAKSPYAQSVLLLSRGKEKYRLPVLTKGSVQSKAIKFR